MKKILTAASLLIASVSGSAAVTVPKYDIAKGKVMAESVCGACHASMVLVLFLHSLTLADKMLSISINS